MKNKSYQTEDGLIFNNRAPTSECYIICKGKSGTPYILMCLRGTGGTHPGLWNVPSGYVDWDETVLYGCFREVFEETGLDLWRCEMNYEFLNFNSSPKLHNQNIVFRYLVKLSGYVSDYEGDFTTRNSEENEVDEIKWVKLEDVTKGMGYPVAFHQKGEIAKIIDQKLYL